MKLIPLDYYYFFFFYFSLHLVKSILFCVLVLHIETKWL